MMIAYTYLLRCEINREKTGAINNDETDKEKSKKTSL